MFFKRLKAEGLGQNSYLLGCGEGLAVVIDPRRDIDEYLQLAQQNDLSISHILETHRQEDFEFGSRTLAAMTGARIVTGTHALFGHSDIKLADEKELTVGITRIVVLETPGHTPESVSMLFIPKIPTINAGAYSPGIRSLSARRGAPICRTPIRPAKMPGSFMTPSTGRLLRWATRPSFFPRMGPARHVAEVFPNATIRRWESRRKPTSSSR
ncbi:MAG: hypothetical protein ABI167_05140 [Nitrosospira sp.]